jgi:short-subunit dehydrogenase
MRNVLLTGCNRGIGYAILEELLDLNDYQIFAVSRSIDSLEVLHTDKLHIYKCDLSNITEALKAIDYIIRISGGIDILINNAGVGIFKQIEDLDINEWEKVLTLNLTTPFILTKFTLPYMKSQNYGRIVNITSDADHTGFGQGSLYCASKFGLRGFSDSVREELTGFNVTITTIGPGRVDTYFNGKKPGDRLNSLSAHAVAQQVIHVLQQQDRCQIERIYLGSVLE